MEKKLRTSALSVVLVLTLVGVAFSQTWNLPNSRQNDRFTTDLHYIVRPALTIRGFDNTDLPNHYDTFDHTKVYGVKQVLERAYGVGMTPVENVGSVLGKMTLDYDVSSIYYSGLDKATIEDNASLAKTMAALALFTYIIEKNDGDPGEPNIFDSGKKALFPDMPSHDDALTYLMSFLTTPPSTLVNYDTDDPFKTARSAMNLAQMWDMYLALENAYVDMDGNTIANQKLLTQSQKNSWNQRFIDYMLFINEHTTKETQLTDLLGSWINVYKDEVQAGNWPMISFVACSYLMLGVNGDIPIDFPASILTKGYKSASTNRTSGNTTNRDYHFFYQTGGGKRYWAEGSYYFSITLEHLIPYYHALRANDFLPKSELTGDGSIIDPFENPNFLNPVEWLADIATPQGYNPPIDDSNNYPIYPATMMNWSAAYGNSSTASVGAKYSHIVNGNYGGNNAFTLVELAMPRQSTISPYPDQVYGGTDYTITENSEQQLVIKYTDMASNKHYVLLNGEHHQAVTAGEGHEQPDQNQLLYYVNATDHLVDPGYDYGQAVLNSSWNEFKYHNVMHHNYLRYYAPALFHRYGGLESPYPNLGQRRKISDHNNIERLNLEHPASMPLKVVQLTGRVQLDVQEEGGWPNYSYLASEYTRHVLFIKDKSYTSGTTPVYLVDFNSLKPRSSQDQSRHQWRMRYRSMGDFTSSPNGTTGWNAVIRSSTSEPSTHIFMSAAEFNPTTFDLIHFNESIRQRDPTNSENIALDNVSGTHFNTMALILPHQAQTLSYTPYKVPTHNASMPAAAWVNQLSTDIIDVIALRGTNLMPYHAGLPVAFNVPAADDFQITLLSSRNFGFARLVRSGGVWSLDSDYSVGIDPGTYSVAANASITLNNASLSSAYQVHVHDNASVTLTGTGTISNKTFKMGSGSRIEIAGAYTFNNVAFEAFDSDFPWLGIEITANNNLFTAVTIRGAMDGVSVKSRNNNFSYCTIEDNLVGIRTFESIPYYSTGRSSFSLADCQLLNNIEGMNLNNTNFHMVRTTVSFTDFPGEFEPYTHSVAMVLNDAHAGSSSYDHFEDNTISGYLTGVYLWGGGSTLNMDPTAWGGGNIMENNSFHFGNYEAVMGTGTTLTIGDAMPNLSLHDPNTINGNTSPLRIYLSNWSTTIPLQAKYSRWNLNPTSNSSSIFSGLVNWSPFVNGGSFQSKMVAESGDVPLLERVHARIDELLEMLNDGAAADARPEILEQLFTTMLLDDESRGEKAQQAEARLLSLSVEGGSGYWNSHEKEQLDRNLLRLALYRHDVGLAAERLDHATSRARQLGEVSGDEADPHMILAELELNMAVYMADYARALNLLPSLREQRRLFMGEQHWVAIDRHFDMLTRHYERRLDEVKTPHIVDKPDQGTNGHSNKSGASEMAPEVFAAYPNPFNPVTLIPVQLNQASDIRMEVFDVIGRRVALLADGPFQAGRHEIQFDAGRLSSGLYLIRTHLEGNVHVQRVTLVK